VKEHHEAAMQTVAAKFIIVAMVPIFAVAEVVFKFTKPK